MRTLVVASIYGAAMLPNLMHYTFAAFLLFAFQQTSPTTPNTTTMAIVTSNNQDHRAAQGPQFSPLYQQIKTLILQTLQSGEWKPGQVIPSETELATRFGVSQGTVRKAVDELAQEKRLVRRQGKGTFVATHAEQHTPYRFLRLVPDSALNTSAPTPGHTPVRQILQCERIRADERVAQTLQLRLAEAVIRIVRTLSFTDCPTILEHIWLPAKIFKQLNLTMLQSDKRPMYALFEADFGISMVRAEEKIKAVSADAALAAMLQVQLATPLLWVERKSFTYQNQPMELRQAWYVTDEHHYQNSLY